jgi:20S proteasome subunit beta 7
VERLHKVTDTCLLGVSGDISDYQHLVHRLDNLIIQHECRDDGHVLHAPNIYEYLCMLMYNRRSEFNPLWNQLLVGGVNNGQSFLGFVDLQGTHYQSSTIATGYGAYLAIPILRKAVEGREDEITEAEATQILESCMKVLYYRDCLAINKFQRAKVTADGVEITEPYEIDVEWDVAEYVKGYGA